MYVREKNIQVNMKSNIVLGGTLGGKGPVYCTICPMVIDHYRTAA